MGICTKMRGRFAIAKLKPNPSRLQPPLTLSSQEGGEAPGPARPSEPGRRGKLILPVPQRPRGGEAPAPGRPSQSAGREKPPAPAVGQSSGRGRSSWSRPSLGAQGGGEVPGPASSGPERAGPGPARHFPRPEGSRGSTGSRHGRGAGGGEAIPGFAPRAQAGSGARGSGAAPAGRREPSVPAFAEGCGGFTLRRCVLRELCHPPRFFWFPLVFNIWRVNHCELKPCLNWWSWRSFPVLCSEMAVVEQGSYTLPARPILWIRT